LCGEIKTILTAHRANPFRRGRSGRDQPIAEEADDAWLKCCHPC